MTMTIEHIKQLTAEFQAAKEALQSQIQTAPESPDIWDNDRDDTHTMAERLRSLSTDFMPPAALAMYAQLVDDMELFGSIINSKVMEVSNHNTKIRLEIDKLTKDFLASIRVPESDLRAALIVNKKSIEPVDYDVLEAVYRSLGLTHYTIKAQSDVVYYNPDKWYFNTLKDDLFDMLSIDLRKKYPTLLNFIQNSAVNTNPLYGRGLIEVMESRKV